MTHNQNLIDHFTGNFELKGFSTEEAVELATILASDDRTFEEQKRIEAAIYDAKELDRMTQSGMLPSLTMLQQDRPKMIRPDSAYIVTDIVPDKSPPK